MRLILIESQVNPSPSPLVPLLICASASLAWLHLVHQERTYSHCWSPQSRAAKNMIWSSSPKLRESWYFIIINQKQCYQIHFCSFHITPTTDETLPEAQRTKGIESITRIITHGKKHFGGEMKYMSDYKNQAWSLKLNNLRSWNEKIQYQPF